MRGLILIAMFVASAFPAFAAHRITVGQLHTILVEQKKTSKRDEEVARQIGGLELSERLSPFRLSQFCAELQPGPKTVLALTILGDLSAFLDLPADELPSVSQPDFVARKAMLGATVKYEANNIQRLPNFFATRTTRSFDDSPTVPINFGVPPLRGGLHFVDRIDQEIAFRNGREELSGSTLESGSKQSRSSSPRGLSSWGEFGTLQAIILADAAKGELKWSHWERGASGVEAVFDFAVPQSASHYLVDYCCVRKSEGPDPDHPYIRRDATANAYKATPAYHGTVSLDPLLGQFYALHCKPSLRNPSQYRGATFQSSSER